MRDGRPEVALGMTHCKLFVLISDNITLNTDLNEPNKINCMFSPMPRVLVQTRMGVERTLGYDLAFHSIPH